MEEVRTTLELGGLGNIAECPPYRSVIAFDKLGQAVWIDPETVESSAPAPPRDEIEGLVFENDKTIIRRRAQEEEEEYSLGRTEV